MISRYELSQDLLDKQIEVLERKYGGVKARTAAIVIQRAFRHYMLLKKFAHITAMAKAERRLSRRIQNFEESERNLCPLPEAEYEIHSTPPLRSMSLREHRNTGFHMPRSYSGRCDLTYYSSSSQHYYSPQQFFADHNKVSKMFFWFNVCLLCKLFYLSMEISNCIFERIFK